MMTDIASLGYKIDSSGAVSATKDLNAMSDAAKKAETSATGLSGGASKAEASVTALGKDARTTAGSLDAAAAAGAKASSATSALELKAREAGFTLAGYEQHLARAAKDQALLAAEARQTALAVERSNAAIAATPAKAGGGGAGVPVINGGSIQAAEAGVAKAANSTRSLTRNLVSASAASAIFSGDMGKIGTAALVTASSIDATAAAALLFTPIGLAMAAAVAVAAGAFVLFKSDCDKAADNDAFVKSLGLSKKELKQLGDTSVTTGDILKGFWRTIDQDGKVSKTFKDIADWGVGAFRVVLESVEWFVAGAFAGLNAVAHAMKGIAMVATGDFSGFDYFNHSLDNLISDTKAAKASMDQFWASVQKNTVAVNHERVAASAAAIRAERTAKDVKTEAQTDPKWQIAKDREGAFGKPSAEVLGRDPWADIKVPSVIITSVDELAKALGEVGEKYSAIKDAGREFSQTVGDAFYDAATGAGNFFDSLTGGLARLAAQWAAADIEHILNKLFKIDDSDTYKQNPLSGIGDSIAGLFSGKSSAPSYDGGGYTGNGSRSGGIDGKGGFWSVMHPQETVTDHTKGQSVPGGFDPREMAMAFVGHLTSELDRRASANRSYSDAKISGFNRALPKRLGQIQRQGT